MKKWRLVFHKGIYVIENNNGEVINYNPMDGIQILEDKDGYAYLDLNGNGRIDRFEDWHLSELERYQELQLNLI
ncbi:MAG: hypothetical protein IKM20_03590 [Erysipelotrichales bacterium]|nr:hypothetical protein [Erysipelotrichales bacterium]